MMEFEAKVKDQFFSISRLENGYFFISGQAGSYILYKSRKWLCADEIPQLLLKELGRLIDEHLHRQPLKSSPLIG